MVTPKMNSQNDSFKDKSTLESLIQMSEDIMRISQTYNLTKQPKFPTEWLKICTHYSITLHLNTS